MADNTKLQRIIAILVIGVLLVFLVIALLPFLNAFFGAMILFVIFSPLYSLLAKRLNKRFSAVVVMLLSFVIIIIPLLVIIPFLITGLGDFVATVKGLPEQLQMLGKFIPGLQLEKSLGTIVANVGVFVQGLLVKSVQGITKLVVSIFIAYFMLYYLFVNKGNTLKGFSSLMPFNKKNTKVLQDEFTMMTHSTIISAGVIALIQGSILGFTFYFLGVSNALLWGLMAVLLSFIPFVGVPSVWIPATLIQFGLGHTSSAITILVVGLIVSNIDNILRPLLQQKFAKVHPLLSLLGVLVGVPFFGILGLIIGPLLLSYFFLMVHMFRDEYLQ